MMCRWTSIPLRLDGLSDVQSPIPPLALPAGMSAVATTITTPPAMIRSASTPNPSKPILTPRPRLFEHFLVLGCSPSPVHLSKHIPTWTEEPKVILKFPHHAHVHTTDLARFAFPGDVTLERLDMSASGSGYNALLYGQKQFRRGDNCHTFVLTDASGARLYGICVIAKEITSLTDAHNITHDVAVPICYCLVSRYPFFSLHQTIILSLLMLLHFKRVQLLSRIDPSTLSSSQRGKPLGPHQVSACITLLKRYYDCVVPCMGETLTLPVPKLLLPISFTRGTSIHGDSIGSDSNETMTYMREWCCVLAWSYISCDVLIDLLELALREYKIVVVDSNLALLSAACMSIHPMLQPLTWCGAYIPILPNFIADTVCQAPGSILIGVVTLPDGMTQHKMVDEHTCVWFPSTNKLWLPR